jgi:hypothetical protein
VPLHDTDAACICHDRTCRMKCHDRGKKHERRAGDANPPVTPRTRRTRAAIAARGTHHGRTGGLTSAERHLKTFHIAPFRHPCFALGWQNSGAQGVLFQSQRTQSFRAKPREFRLIGERAARAHGWHALLGRTPAVVRKRPTSPSWPAAAVADGQGG